MGAEEKPSRFPDPDETEGNRNQPESFPPGIDLEQRTPDVERWIAHQNQRTRDMVEAFPEVGNVRQRLTELNSLQTLELEDASSTWQVSHDRQRVVATEDPGQVIFSVTDTPVAAEQIKSIKESPDHRQLLLQMRKGGRVFVQALDINHRELKTDVVEVKDYSSVVWAPDNSGFYYVDYPDIQGVVKFHLLGSVAEDEIIFQPDNVEVNDVYLWSAGNHIVIQEKSGDWKKTGYAVHLASPANTVRDRATEEQAAMKVERVVELGQTSGVLQFLGDNVYLSTDQGANNRRLIRASLIDGSFKQPLDKWKEVIPEQPSRVLKDFTVAGDKVLLHYFEQGASRLVMYSPADKSWEEIELPSQFGAIQKWPPNSETSELHFIFATVTTAPEYLILDTTTGELKSKSARTEADQPVIESLHPENYLTEFLNFPTTDNLEASMVVVRGKNAPQPQKMLMYVYGGFGMDMAPTFSPTFMTLLERGYGIVLVHARGGQEYGVNWQTMAQRQHKHRTVEDVNAAATWLIDSGYTTDSQLAVWGASNGAVMAAAAVNQNPSNWGAAVADRGPLNLQQFAARGDGKQWIPEFGDPSNAAEAEALNQLSPVHNIPEAIPPSW